MGRDGHGFYPFVVLLPPRNALCSGDGVCNQPRACIPFAGLGDLADPNPQPAEGNTIDAFILAAKGTAAAPPTWTETATAKWTGSGVAGASFLLIPPCEAGD